MEKMFENAVRNKYRFNYHGSISVEDLWDLDVRALDQIFKGLKSEEKKESEESLLATKSKEEKIISEKIAIIRYIVAVKQEEAQARKNAAANKEQKQKILEIISRKQDAALEGKSIEELMAMANSL